MVDFDPRFEIMPGTKAGEPRRRTCASYEVFHARPSQNSNSSRAPWCAKRIGKPCKYLVARSHHVANMFVKGQTRTIRACQSALRSATILSARRSITLLRELEASLLDRARNARQSQRRI